MIRIRRDEAEPSALAKARVCHVAVAAKARRVHGLSSKEFAKTLVGYNAVAIKEKLYEMQHQKCAWCECKPPFSSSPVEHFRPKNGAWRHLPNERPVTVDKEHYWWLTWTWTNLFFACPRCNDRGHKANYFPLAHGTTPIAPPKPPRPPYRFDTSGEKPLLIDPSRVDPLEHIQWVPGFTHLKRERWSWLPNGITPEGKTTIRILKLAEMADFVQDHLKTSVLPSLEEIEKHLGATPRRVKDAHKRWDKLCRATLAPESAFSAATWCALEIWMPKAKRGAHGLTEPRRPGS